MGGFWYGHGAVGGSRRCIDRVSALNNVDDKALWVFEYLDRVGRFRAQPDDNLAAALICSGADDVDNIARRGSLFYRNVFIHPQFGGVDRAVNVDV